VSKPVVADADRPTHDSRMSATQQTAESADRAAISLTARRAADQTQKETSQ
jgi:hypothetical protein